MLRIMTAIELPIPYIYGMNSERWKHNSTAPVWIKSLVWFSMLATLFFIVHTSVLFIFSEEIGKGTFYIAAWTQEIYFNIWVAVPLMLFLVGKSLNGTTASKVLVWFTGLFGACYLLNIGNTYEWVDIPHLQFPMSAFLLGILITWITIVIKRKKTVLDGLKFIWLLGFAYSFIVPRFVSGGHEAGNFLLASMFVFPFMMLVGSVQFFRKPKTITHAT